MKRIGLVFLALVVALGSLGAAYAMWKDEVFVTSVVNTGSVCIRLSGQAVLDDDAPNGNYLTPPFDYTCRDGFAGPNPRFWVMGTNPLYPNEIGKNVSWGECFITGPAGCEDTMTVNLYETYPSNFNSVTAYVENCGTVPVIIWKTEVWFGGVKIGEFDNTGQYLAFDVNGDGANDVEVSYGDNFGAQLEPGGLPAEISYWIHTLQAAPQGAHITFSFVIWAVQYNEYTPLP